VVATVILSLFAQSAINLGFGLNYELNKKYISEHFCENRSKPCMHCNGKCYLSKQLQKENDERGKAPVRTFSNEDVFVSDLPAKYSFSFLPDLRFHSIIRTGTRLYSLNYSFRNFRPPLAA